MSTVRIADIPLLCLKDEYSLTDIIAQLQPHVKTSILTVKNHTHICTFNRESVFPSGLTLKPSQAYPNKTDVYTFIDDAQNEYLVCGKEAASIFYPNMFKCITASSLSYNGRITYANTAIRCRAPISNSKVID